MEGAAAQTLSGIIRYVTHNPPLEARDYKEAVAALG